MRFLGYQLVVELSGCDASLLADVDTIREAMLESARRAGCTIVTQAFHHFSPFGVSGAVIIAESHLAIHTWPEYGYAAVDVFTCGDAADPEKAAQYLVAALKANSFTMTRLERGALSCLSSPTPTPIPTNCLSDTALCASCP